MQRTNSEDSKNSNCINYIISWIFVVVAYIINSIIAMPYQIKLHYTKTTAPVLSGVQMALHIRDAGEQHQGVSSGVAERDSDATSGHAAGSRLPNPHDRQVAPGLLRLVPDPDKARVRFLLRVLRWCPGLFQPLRY